MDKTHTHPHTPTYSQLSPSLHYLSASWILTRDRGETQCPAWTSRITEVGETARCMPHVRSVEPLQATTRRWDSPILRLLGRVWEWDHGVWEWDLDIRSEKYCWEVYSSYVIIDTVGNGDKCSASSRKIAKSSNATTVIQYLTWWSELWYFHADRRKSTVYWMDSLLSYRRQPQITAILVFLVFLFSVTNLSITFICVSVMYLRLYQLLCSFRSFI